METKAICVYGASSSRIDPKYIEAGRRVGELIARAGRTLVCGGGSTGMMAAAIDGAVAEGGRTVGIIPAFMEKKGWAHAQLSETIVTHDMHVRKETMLRLSTAAIALPGGVGTLEELLECATWIQLGLYGGRLVILNVDGYYDPLLEMLKRAADENFMRDDQTLYEVASTPEEAVAKAIAND